MALPERKYLTHKPQEVRNLSAKAQEQLNLGDGNWIFQHKFDGCHVIVLVGINIVRIFSREGKECFSMPHIAEHFRKTSAPNMVYFGEAYHPDMEFKDISGMFRRQKPQDDLHFFMFDAVTLQEFRTGSSSRAYIDRIKALRGVASAVNQVIPPRLFTDQAIALSEAQRLRDTTGWKYGLDGLMAKQIEGTWEAGVDRQGRQLKLKDVLSVDLEVAGVVEGEGKFAGMVGAIEVYWRGERAVVSGGKLTTAERQAYWDAETAPRADRHDEEQQVRLVGQIVEVHALGLTPDGKLREPRFQRIRDDKTEASE